MPLAGGDDTTGDVKDDSDQTVKEEDSDDLTKDDLDPTATAKVVHLQTAIDFFGTATITCGAMRELNSRQETVVFVGGGESIAKDDFIKENGYDDIGHTGFEDSAENGNLTGNL